MNTTYDTSNLYFQSALQFVNQTARHIFLTGKAGTGKTTFLRYIRDNCYKKMAIVAPTGVAAINAGGTTMHSFFQLPFGPYLPVRQTTGNDTMVTNEHTLFKNLRFNNNKRELLQELELLVIDEVSMLRADTLDAIDAILRHFRRQPLVPFGGVQMLYIGDLFQLPPVVNNGEWDILKNIYRSPFFFDALAIKQSPPVYLELKKIYRQNEALFIDILNNVRNNTTTEKDFIKLHNYYKPGYEPPREENYITLTTHNVRADSMNRQQLEKLPGKPLLFDGVLSGDFNEKALPAEKTLQLKEGAQVMFVKNDKGDFRKYYNGKIATVSRINKDKIYVLFPSEEEELLLEKETWKNIRYNYNKEKDNIDEEELGSFTQYPIRLAWAITIHKSQGLTFTKAIIDAGASFAPGQVYVALSRLTSLDGLILYSRIHPQNIISDPHVLNFARTAIDDHTLNQQLQNDQRAYITGSLGNAFNFIKLHERLNTHYDDYSNRVVPDKNKAIAWAKQLVDTTDNARELGARFNRELNTLTADANQTIYSKLHERIASACGYFDRSLEEMLASLKQHINEMKVKKKVKKYIHELHYLELDLTRKKHEIARSLILAEGLMNGTDLSDLLNLAGEQKKTFIAEEEMPATEVASSKPKKGDTQRMSLEMYKEGKAIVEIAKLRELAVTTIEGHLAQFITTGDIQITDLVAPEKISSIRKAIEETTLPGTSPVKEKLGDHFSHGEIKAVMLYLELEKQFS